MRTEKEKMLAGELYDPMDAQLLAERGRARTLLKLLNDSDPSVKEERAGILNELFGVRSNVCIEPPFYCDYGTNIDFGTDVFMNFNCVVLDVAPVTIGDFVLCGPNVQIYTASHPMDAALRRRGLECAAPVAISTDVWIGGGVVLCPGVTIGQGSVIGAGSVVTRNIPEGVFAAGNPCRVIRPISQSA